MVERYSPTLNVSTIPGSAINYSSKPPTPAPAVNYNYLCLAFAVRTFAQVPVRVEVGPRDVEQGTCVTARRDVPGERLMGG